MRLGPGSEMLGFMARGWSILIWSGALFSGCAGVRQAVDFDGRPQPPLVAASELREVVALPLGTTEIGEVSAQCRLKALDASWDSVPLSDVDCSEARVVNVMREAAAELGGEFMVGRRCRTQPAQTAETVGTQSVYCAAGLARWIQPDNSLTRSARAIQAIVSPKMRAREAWNLRVDFVRAPGVASRKSVPLEAVKELHWMPPNQKSLGDLVTRCEQGCTADGAFAGLFAAASRLGAQSVVGPRCVARAQGFWCSATVAGFVVDPAVDLRAR